MGPLGGCSPPVLPSLALNLAESSSGPCLPPLSGLGTHSPPTLPSKSASFPGPRSALLYRLPTCSLPLSVSVSLLGLALSSSSSRTGSDVLWQALSLCQVEPGSKLHVALNFPLVLNHPHAGRDIGVHAVRRIVVQACLLHAGLHVLLQPQNGDRRRQTYHTPNGVSAIDMALSLFRAMWWVCE